MADDERRKPTPGDPSGIEKPHDVLAAEEFAMPTRDAPPVPPDPSGIEAPHDVLAAEEFAMPTGGGAGGPVATGQGGGGLLRLAALLALAALVIALVRRR